MEELKNAQRRLRGPNLPAEAYATMLAAIADGGPPVMSAENLDWIASLEAEVHQSVIVYSCKRSGTILMTHGRARGANGLPPVSMRPPPVFVNPPDREARMPCAATEAPIVSMMSLAGCEAERFVDAAGAEADLYVCER